MKTETDELNSSTHRSERRISMDVISNSERKAEEFGAGINFLSMDNE